MDFLIELDHQFFLWLNGFHHPAMDGVMVWISGKKEWFPFYGLLIGFLFWRFRWKGFLVLVALALLITLCDQTASGFFKPTFERLRPCNEPQLAGLVHTVRKCGSGFSFFSSHAANTFGLAFFWFFLLGKEHKIHALLVPWAAVVSYSRIYLGVHYPTDILAGMLCGLLWGWVVYKILLFAFHKLEKKKATFS